MNKKIAHETSILEVASADYKDSVLEHYSFSFVSCRRDKWFFIDFRCKPGGRKSEQKHKIVGDT